MAPGARILLVLVMDGDCVGTSYEVALGIVVAVEAGADVINVSLSSPEPSSILANAIAHAEERGVLVVAAGGNAGQVEYPAGAPGVLAVSAIDHDDWPASFAAIGPRIDLTAPGVERTVPAAVNEQAHVVREVGVEKQRAGRSRSPSRRFVETDQRDREVRRAAGEINPRRQHRLAVAAPARPEPEEQGTMGRRDLHDFGRQSVPALERLPGIGGLQAFVTDLQILTVEERLERLPLKNGGDPTSAAVGPARGA